MRGSIGRAENWARSIPMRFWGVELRLRRLEQAVFTTSRIQVEAAANLLRPRQSSHVFTRIGANRDGGYVIVNDTGIPDLVVSIGVGGECSSDDELARRGAKVFQFDHTVEASPAKHSNVTFVRRGLGNESRAHTDTLERLMADASIPDAGTAWLMLDAEGVEWDLATYQTSTLERFDQIVIEFHLLSLLGDPRYAEGIIAALNNLAASFVPVSWHPNNFAPTHIIADRFVPDVLEVGYIRKDLFRPGDETPPTTLFLPNDARRAEHPEPFTAAPVSTLGPLPASLEAAAAQR